MHKGRLACLLAIAVLLAGCMGNSEAAKKKALDNGDKYLKQGKLREASIIYRNILKKDAKYGPAYARLGDVELKRGRPTEAVRALLRAVELLPKDEDVAGKLADIYLVAYSASRRRNENLLKDVKALSDTLLGNNPNSYQGTRLVAFLAVAENNLVRAEESFRKADQLKPKQPELQFALTQVLAQQDKWPEAEDLSKKIIAESPKYRPSYDFLIMNYMRRDRQKDAEEMIRKKVASFPGNVDAVIQLAAFLQAMGRREEAEQTLQDILKDPKKYPDGRLKVGDFYAKTSRPEKALEVLGAGVTADPDRKVQYRLRMATVYTSLRKVDEALKVVEATIQDDPKSNDAISMRAALLLTSGDKQKTQQAVTDLQQLLAKTPDNLVVRYNLARAYHMRNELDAARVQYEQATKIRSDFVGAWLGLGQVQLAKRDFGKAIAAADEIFKYSPSNLGAQVIKTNGLINSGNLRQARAELDEYLRQHPNSPDLQFQSALIYIAEKKPEEAEKLLRPLRVKYPNDARVLFSLAEILLNTNRGPEAVSLLQSEVAKSPQRADLHNALGNATIRTSQYDVAEKEFRQLIQMEPNNSVYHLKLGEILRRRGDMQGALDMLGKAQKIAPDDAVVNLQLALMLESTGRRKDSQGYYENVLKSQPDNPIALNNLAFLLAEDGVELDTALTYAQRARQQMPQNPDVADTVGWIYLKKNLHDPALTIFRELTARNPKNPTYHYHMGLALYQMGDRTSAKKSLQTALALKPDSISESKIRDLLSKLG